MAIVKQLDKRTGNTYVYTSESYWDKEKKQPRSKRTLIGKLDPVTGEIVPTGKSGRHKQPIDPTVAPITDSVELLALKDKEINDLKAQIRILQREREEIKTTLNIVMDRLSK